MKVSQVHKRATKFSRYFLKSAIFIRCKGENCIEEKQPNMTKQVADIADDMCAQVKRKATRLKRQQTQKRC